MRLLSVGKLKVPFWKDAAAHYSQRINRWRRLECVEVRDGDPALPQAQRNELEGRRLLEALGPQDVPLVLDERGPWRCCRSFAAAGPAGARSW